MVGGTRIFAFNFHNPATGKPQYWRDIGLLDAYFAAHLDLLGPEPVFDLHDPEWPLRSRPALYPPSKYVSRDSHLTIEDSLIAGGCNLQGAVVRRAVLSPKVKIGTSAVVEEAILWDAVEIGPGARIKRAIIEEGVLVPPNFTIGYDPKTDARRLPITEGGVVTVPNNVILEE